MRKSTFSKSMKAMGETFSNLFMADLDFVIVSQAPLHQNQNLK